MSNEVAKTEEAKVPAFMSEMYEDAGAGFENVSQEDIRIPLVKIAQALSPQTKKNKAEYIEGLEEGIAFNSANNKIYPNGFKFIPVYYSKTYLEWVPQSKGGGLAGVHGPEILRETRKDAEGKDMLANGNEVVTYAQWFGLILNEDGCVDQVVIPMKGAAHKPSRNIMTVLKALMIDGPKGKFNPPLYFNVLNFTTVAETNKNNQDYFNWKIVREGDINSLSNAGEVYGICKNLFNSIKDGTVKAAEDVAEVQAGADEDIPF